MKRQLGILSVLCFMIVTFPNFSKAITYNHNSITIREIKQHVDFNVLMPKNVPDDWTLEIKTYPWKAKTNFTSFRLHYMDKNDEKMKISIEQTKDAEKQTEENNPYAKTVIINGHVGKLIKWGNDGEVDYKGEILTGGVLQWTQDGTIIELFSLTIPIEKMLEIARSIE